jgi:hypothetical protein
MGNVAWITVIGSEGIERSAGAVDCPRVALGVRAWR